MRPAPDRRVEPPCTEKCEPSALVLVVPMPANVTNRRSGGSHWRTIHAERTRYRESLDALAAICQHGAGDGCHGYVIPPTPPSPLRCVRISSSMLLRGGMDDDNAIARHKPIIDWLVSRGYLATDRRERKKDGASCRWAGLPEQRVSRTEPPRVTLTITPVTPDAL